jgi:tRNA (adenine57-N1/adenine58-N1)-methyltransferase
VPEPANASPHHEPVGARGRRGPLRIGERVQLTDDKGRQHTITLEAGKRFHTHRGAIDHDALIGAPEGTVAVSDRKIPYLALRPMLSDFVVSMPRGATVVYPKDAAAIVGVADLFPGARVLEAGAGSGGLTCTLLRAVGDHGAVHSYERREEFAQIAEKNVATFFGGPHPAWRLTLGDLSTAELEGPYDRVVLDMLAPWDCVAPVAEVMEPGGVLVTYVATTTQLSRTVETVREHGGFTEPVSSETIVRGWHVEGLAVRPDHRMVGHTGFLMATRRLAPEVTAPPRRRRPSKGSYGDDYAAAGDPGAQVTDSSTDGDAPPRRPNLP